MNRYAFLSDIHGNAIALEAVLAHLPPIDKLIILGDSVSDGAQAHRVIELLQQHADTIIMGNMDALMLNPVLDNAPDERHQKFADASLWSAAQLTNDELDFIKHFQNVARMDDIVCYHGSPRHNEDVIIPTTNDEQLKEYFAGYEDAKIFIGGHTHQHFVRRWREAQVIVAGSVGLAYRHWTPHHAPRANYAEYTLITTNDGDTLDISLRRVPYDVNVYQEALRTCGMPHADWFIKNW